MYKKRILLILVLIISIIVIVTYCEYSNAQDKTTNDSIDVKKMSDNATKSIERINTAQTNTSKLKDLKLYKNIPSLLGLSSSTVILKDKSRSIKLNGKLEYNKDLFYYVSPRQSAYILDIYKTIGDSVNKGDLLMKLESHDLDRLQQDYLDAKALKKVSSQDLSQSSKIFDINKRRYEQTKAIYKNAESKLQEAIRKKENAEKSYETSKKITNEARKRYSQSISIYKTTKIDYERTKKLYKEGIKSEADYLDAERKVIKEEQQISMIKQEITRLMNDENRLYSEVIHSDEVISQIEQELSSIRLEIQNRENELTKSQQSVYDAKSNDTVHQNHLRKAKSSLEIIGYDDISNLNHNEAINPIINLYSPVSGIIIDRNANKGQLIDKMAQIYTITDIKKLWAYIDVYESDFRYLQVGQKVKITAIAYPKDEFWGTVDFLNTQVNDKSRTIRVRLQVDNEKQKLLAGMFINAYVNWKSNEKALYVSSYAGIPIGNEYLVFVVKDKDTYEPRLVKLGEEVDSYREVYSGLNEGEKVIADGNFILDSESQLLQILPDIREIIEKQEDK